MSSSPVTISWRARLGHLGRCGARRVRHAHRSCEDADPARADEEADDNENDAEQNLPSNRGHDAGDDQDHGENPKQSDHETYPGDLRRSAVVFRLASSGLGESS
jgi:hypothetical protein